MAWTDISAPSVGEATKKVSFADAVIGNLVYLKANMGGSGGGGDLIVNGDFELDSDSDGIPDGWDLTEYTGGAFDLDVTTPMQGAASAKFTSPGASGGGDLQSTDFFAVSPKKAVIGDFLISASVAGIHNLVEIRWYSTALEANYISTSTLYDSEANPTSARRYTPLAIPPATARFAKLKLIGAKNDNATAGIAYFDSVSAYEAGGGHDYIDIGPFNGSSTYADVTLPLPTLSAKGRVRITIYAEAYCLSATNPVMWFSIGSYLSNTLVPSGSSYAEIGPFVLHYTGAGGNVTLRCNLQIDSGSDIYARMVDEPVLIEMVNY